MIYEARSREDAESSWATDCIPPGYEEFPEFRVTPFAETYQRIRESVESYPRLEVRVQVGGCTEAVAIYVLEEDMHVGPCYSIQWMYIKPEYRGKGIAEVFLEILKRKAKDAGVPYSYTKRRRNGYQVIYSEDCYRG